MTELANEAACALRDRENILCVWSYWSPPTIHCLCSSAFPVQLFHPASCERLWTRCMIISVSIAVWQKLEIRGHYKQLRRALEDVQALVCHFFWKIWQLLSRSFLTSSDHFCGKEQKSIFLNLYSKECGMMLRLSGDHILSRYSNVPVTSMCCGELMHCAAQGSLCLCFQQHCEDPFALIRGAAEDILTRPRSLCAHPSIPISFLGCPNSISSFRVEEVRDCWNTKCSVQHDFSTHIWK